MGGKKRQPVGPIKTTPPMGPRIEYRHKEDDAWYNVQLLLNGDTLTVKFVEFPDDHDVSFNAGQFKTKEEITEFRKRFRPLCWMLEASDCGTVKEGMKVCAIRDFGHHGRFYYDALVEVVKREEHTFVDGVEECPCSVVLSWLHGPESGTLTFARVEDLCPIQTNHLDPRLACFLELAKWKHDIAAPHSNLITEDTSSTKVSPTLIQSKKRKSQTSNQIFEGRRQLGNAVPSGNFGDERNEDVDLGGGDCEHTNGDISLVELEENMFSFGVREGDYSEPKGEARYFIMVENLEKDVSPSTITSFIQEATGIKIEAFVLLSMSWESYTRGALVVDYVEDLKMLCEFVLKPEQMIVSSKGRPWIVTEPSATESMMPSFWCLEPDLENERQLSAGDELKVVMSGSDEYSKAEKLKDLFVEFTKHQQMLYKKLALEEQHIFDA